MPNAILLISTDYKDSSMTYLMDDTEGSVVNWLENHSVTHMPAVIESLLLKLRSDVKPGEVYDNIDYKYFNDKVLILQEYSTVLDGYGDIANVRPRTGCDEVITYEIQV